MLELRDMINVVDQLPLNDNVHALVVFTHNGFYLNEYFQTVTDDPDNFNNY